MRRTYVILASLAVLLVLPAQAFAWWDFIEQFSGPRDFWGWDIQVRLFCIVDKVDEKKRTVTTKTGQKEEKYFEVDEKAVEKQVPFAVGMVVSACRVKPSVKDTTYYVRRVAVDVGARFLHGKDNDFANGQQIDFTTLEPSISINLLSKWPALDYVDYAFGAGAYWFSSPGFPSFNGAFIEPVRLEFHPSTKLKMKLNGWASLIPNFRAGFLYFPGGFETASWNARPGIEPRIARERVMNYSVFLDLEPLLR